LAKRCYPGSQVAVVDIAVVVAVTIGTRRADSCAKAALLGKEICPVDV
jgi:hypothetical protein